MSQFAKLEAELQTTMFELTAVSARLGRYEETFRWEAGETLVDAFVLAREVKRLCAKAALSRDRSQSEALLARARHQLDKLQKILGAQ
jgi:hypothetical protein